MNPAMRALDMQDRTRSWFQTSNGTNFVQQVCSSPDGRGADFFTSVMSASRGDTYYIDGQAHRLIDHAATTLPLEYPVLRTLLPSVSGYIYIPHGIATKGEHLAGEIGPLTIRAITWGCHLDSNRFPADRQYQVGNEKFVNSDEATPEDSSGVVFGFWCDIPGNTIPLLLAAWNMTPNNSLAHLQSIDPSDHFLEGAKYLIGFWSFIQQRILVPVRVVADRATARRIAQPGKEPPAVRVVLLRSAQHHKKEGETQTIDWQYRWLVRGHWRAQWYPAHEEHRRIWVMPHIKGPESRPIKTPATVVFNVQR